MINDIFGLNFEVVQEGSAGIFHDSVDALFSSKDIPLGFNVLDFQGTMANRDYKLIESLLSHIPQSFVFL